MIKNTLNIDTEGLIELPEKPEKVSFDQKYKFNKIGGQDAYKNQKTPEHQKRSRVYNGGQITENLQGPGLSVIREVFKQNPTSARDILERKKQIMTGFFRASPQV